MPSIVSLDAQGFAGRNGEFVVRELAFCSEAEGEVTRYHLQPPYTLAELPSFRRKSVSYVTHHIHGLEWRGGEQPYEEGRSAISSDLMSLPGPIYCYCKGKEKALSLSEFLGIKVFNVEDIMEEAYVRTYYVFITDNGSNCQVHKQRDSYLKCAVKEAYALRILLQSFFNPQHARLRLSCLDLNNIDCRVDSFRMLRNCLHDSLISSYLAKIGYFCNGAHLQCNFCKAAVSDWQDNGCVKPHVIPHFHESCPQLLAP